MSEPRTDVLALLTAINFAANKHKDQRRKDKRTPYINHPVEVAHILASTGQVADAEILCAAILHDVLEDTATQPEEIRTAFGDRILSLVLECSDDRTLSRLQRKQLQIETAPHKTDGAKQIKIADKISNMRDMVESPPADWEWERKAEYLDWCQQVFNGLKGINRDLDQLFETVSEQSRQILGACQPHQAR